MEIGDVFKKQASDGIKANDSQSILERQITDSTPFKRNGLETTATNSFILSECAE
jgi:hypothetical protein